MINFLIRQLRMSTLLTHTFVNKSLISSNMNSLFLGSGVEDRGLEKCCFTRTLFPFRKFQYMSSAGTADQQAAKVLVTRDTISQVFWAEARQRKQVQSCEPLLNFKSYCIAQVVGRRLLLVHVDVIIRYLDWPHAEVFLLNYPFLSLALAVQYAGDFTEFLVLCLVQYLFRNELLQ